MDTIRSRQTAALRNVMNLNEVPHNSLVAEPVWKVLVLDRNGQDVVSPLLSVKHLRQLGVTLHLLIGSSRDALPDVPAVYLVTPNDENVDLLSNDLRQAFYGAFYINFLSPLSRPRLETLAAAAVQGGTVSNVHKVVDQYLNFISLEEDLFTLRRYSEKNAVSYFTINDPSTTDAQMNALLEEIADGLFSVCATLGVVPIIRCPAGNASEMVATKLEQKLRDNLRDARNNLFAVDGMRAGQLHGSRTLLVIADRSADLSTMLHHTWTYQALIHDVFNLDQNRVTISSAGKRKEYDMNTGGTDILWAKHRGSAFPLVAEAIQEDVDDYKGKEEEIKTLKQHIGMGDNAELETAMGSMITDATSKLGSTVTSLPLLLERKRLIDEHTTIATSLLEAIKERKLDSLFELEQKLLQRSQLDRSILEEIRSLSNNNDILRIVLIFLLCSPNASKADKDALLGHLTSVGVDTAPVNFIEKIKCVSELSRSSSDGSDGGGQKASSMLSKFISHGSNLFMEGVKNLVPKKTNLALTALVDSLVSASSSSSLGVPSSKASEADSLRFFDPKLMHALSKEAAIQRAKQMPPPQDVILFVIGGGNYVEYQNFIEYGKTKNLVRCTYGCTELINPSQFLDQLTRLGHLYK